MTITKFSIVSIVSFLLLVQLTRGFISQYQTIRRTTCGSLNLFDKLANAFSKAFENDNEYSEKDDPGVTNKSNSKRKPISSKVSDTRMVNTRWLLRFAIQGIPFVDESNNLYAAKKNAGKIDGVEMSIEVKLLEGGILSFGENEFTVKDSMGKWKLDAEVIAFSFPTVGFERTVKTTGSIMSVYGGDSTSRTSSTYFVPSGTALMQAQCIANANGRLIVRDGKLLAKDPRDAGGGKFTPPAAWKKTGYLLEAVEIEAS